MIWILALSLTLVAGGGLYWFQPWKLVTDREVNDSLAMVPTPMPSGMMASGDAMMPGDAMKSGDPMMSGDPMKSGDAMTPDKMMTEPAGPVVERQARSSATSTTPREPPGWCATRTARRCWSWSGWTPPTVPTCGSGSPTSP